jgi:hypothetical protein
MIEKKTIEVTNSETNEIETKDIFVETITTTKEQEITIDMVDSSITQIDNTIAGLEEQKLGLQAKKAEMLAL